MENLNTAPGVPETPAPVASEALDTSAEAASEGLETSASETPDSQPGKPEISAEDAFNHPAVKKRLEQQTWARREAERRNDQLIELITRQQGSPATQQQVDAAGKPPSLADFNYDESKYQQALLDFATRAAEKTVTAKLSDWERQQSQQRQAQTFKAKEAAFAATVEDYAEKVYDPSVPISAAMAEAIADSDIGPQLAYHLADNRELAARIASLSPVQAARELGKLEAKLSAPSPKPVTKAPPPPPKIAAAEGEVDKDPDKMGIDEWMKWREKQLRSRNR